MADFSLPMIFVVPVGATIPSTGSTQDLTAGQLGIFSPTYVALTSGTVAAANYFYVAQGRTNKYLEMSKRSDKIKGCPSGSGCKSNVIEWYKVNGCPSAANQIVDVGSWHVKCGDIVTLTLRAHSSYIDTLYMNGLTRSVTVQAPCCTCGESTCDDVDVPALIDAFIVKLTDKAPGINPDNVFLTTFFNFERVGTGSTAKLRIHGKPLTAYGQPCDIAAFPHEYDRMWFRSFVYSGPATTADFIVSDSCNIVATATTIQSSTYPTGTATEIAQMEKNWYSYQTSALKHLYRTAGYNELFESFVTTGYSYDTYYIKFNEYTKDGQNWGDYVAMDNLVVIAVPIIAGNAYATALEAILVAGLGSVTAGNVCITTTTTTTATPTTTTTTSHA